MFSCRTAIKNVDLTATSHSGLILQRCLQSPITSPESERKKLLHAARAAQANSKAIYQMAFERWKQALSGYTEIVSVQGRMIVGLGADNVLEAGLTLQHTYGTPVIPGSALKGIASNYCNQVWGAMVPEFRGSIEPHDFGKRTQTPGKCFREIFGTSETAGHITFHDAWIVPNANCLQLDVLTPHHSEYYSGKGSPTDSDSPVPVTFLTVAGDFLLAVSCDVDGELGQKWERLALDLLCEALSEWGVGGKTSSGYGRLLRKTLVPVVPGQARPKDPPPRLKYKAGDKVNIVRSEDVKGKKKYKVDDGTPGNFAGEEPPTLDVGGSAEVWIANVGVDNYTLTRRDSSLNKKGQKNTR